MQDKNMVKLNNFSDYLRKEVRHWESEWSLWGIVGKGRPQKACEVGLDLRATNRCGSILLWRGTRPDGKISLQRSQGQGGRLAGGERDLWSGDHSEWCGWVFLESSPSLSTPYATLGLSLHLWPSDDLRALVLHRSLWHLALSTCCFLREGAVRTRPCSVGWNLPPVDKLVPSATQRM